MAPAGPVDPVVLRERTLSAAQLKFAADAFDPGRLTAALPALVAGRVSFELGSKSGNPYLAVVSASSLAQRAAARLASTWPGVTVQSAEVSMFSSPLAGWRLSSSLPDALPLLPSSEKHFDLSASLLGLLTSFEDVDAAFQVVVEPFADVAWRERAMAAAQRLTRTEQTWAEALAGILIDLPQPEIPSMRWLNAYQQEAYSKAAERFLFHVSPRFVASGRSATTVRSVAVDALRLVQAAFAGGPDLLSPAHIDSAEHMVDEYNNRRLIAPVVMTPAEISVLWHPPREVDAKLRISRSLFARGPEIAAPRVLPQTGIIIGHDPLRPERQLALPATTFRQQTAVLGATGTGKSTAALSIFLSAVSAGLGGLLLDVKGDLALDALGRIPADRADDILLLDAADEECGLSIDPMGVARSIDRDLSADILVSCFEREFRDSWGVVIERLMRATVRALLEVDGTTLLDLPRFLRHDDFREAVLSRVQDEMVGDYFRHEFEAMSPSRRLQAVGPVLNRVGAALESNRGRRFFGRSGSIDLAALRRRGGILIARFPQGLIGEKNANIFASLTMTACLFSGLMMAAETEASRGEWVAVCDEFQNYANSSFAKAYSEGRSFGICMVACTQFLGAVPEDVRAAILANANTLICFRLGEDDAGLIGRRFEPQVSRVQLTDLDNFLAAVRTSVGGERLPPFTMKVRPPSAPWNREVADRIREGSHVRRPEIEPVLNAVPSSPFGRPTRKQKTEHPALQAWPDIEEEEA